MVLPRGLKINFLKGLAGKASPLFLMLFLGACATYQGKVSGARQAIEGGRFQEAVAQLKPLAEEANGDQLAYLLDYATALQIDGQVDESTKQFLAADKLAAALDYHSITRDAGSFLLNEEAKQYKGDTFEKIFINAELALNYLQKGMLDDALVESRRINEKYLLLRSEDKKNFELNPFAKYLSAVIWEANHNYDDAYIAYEEAFKLSPGIEGIHEDLIRSAKLARRDDMYKKWKSEFSNVQESPDWYDKGGGELVVVVQQGWGPRKVFNPRDQRWPMLQTVGSSTQRVQAEIGETSGQSHMVYDVSFAAIRTLEDDRASLVARRLGAFATKAIVADQIRQRSELLGFLAYIGLMASDRADLRQWSTLPASEQIIRIRLKPGAYKLNLHGTDWAGGMTSDRLSDHPVTIKPGQKTFIVWRTLH